MTGIEKIIAKIEDDCKAVCDEIIAKAEAEAGSLLENAKAQAEKVKNEAILAAQRKCQTDIELARSKAEHDYNREILAAKLDIINGVIGLALNKLKNLPDDEYFDVIEKLIARYSQSGHGELRFSKKDLDRLPEGFEARLNQKFSGSGKSFTISSSPIDIDGGVVIAYSDVEQNCSFNALLNASLDDIKDGLFNELFVRDST